MMNQSPKLLAPDSLHVIQSKYVRLHSPCWDAWRQKLKIMDWHLMVKGNLLVITERGNESQNEGCMWRKVLDGEMIGGGGIRKLWEEGDNAVFEVRELATTFLSVCTGWIGKGRKKCGCTRPAERLRGGQWEEIDTEQMETALNLFVCVAVCVCAPEEQTIWSPIWWAKWGVMAVT